MGIRGKETIIIERKDWGLDDVYGNATYEVINIEVKNCLISWGNQTENGDLFGVSMETTATLLIPQSVAIGPNDIFILPNEERYIQQGKPVQWVGQRGNPIRQKKLVNVIIKESSNDA